MDRAVRGPQTYRNIGAIVDADCVGFNTRGQIALETGDYVEAERLFTAGIERATTATANIRGILASNRAEVYHRTNRPELAVHENLRAIDIHTGDPGSIVELATDYVNLGHVYVGLKKHAEATDCFKRAWDAVRETSPRSLVALNALLGLVRERMLQNDHARARAAAARGLELYEQMRPAIAVTEEGHASFLAAYRSLLEMAMYITLHEGWTDELRSYNASLDKFFAEWSDDILEKKVVPTASWEFRNAAHHSGTATSYVPMPGDTTKAFFNVEKLPNTYVCDGSLLRAAGIANSGLTLVALAYRLAELLRADA